MYGFRFRVAGFGFFESILGFGFISLRFQGFVFRVWASVGRLLQDV